MTYENAIEEPIKSMHLAGWLLAEDNSDFEGRIENGAGKVLLEIQWQQEEVFRNFENDQDNKIVPKRFWLILIIVHRTNYILCYIPKMIF